MGSATPKVSKESAAEFPTKLVTDICDRLAAEDGIKQELPGGGVLCFERLVPFLCVHRTSGPGRDDGVEAFLQGETSSLIAPADTPVRKGLERLIRGLARLSEERFGAFFVIEVWTSPDSEVPRQVDPATGEALLPPPRFRVYDRNSQSPGPAVDDMIFTLELISVHRHPAEVDVVLGGTAHPPYCARLIPNKSGMRLNCFVVGLEILPIYRNLEDGGVYPGVLKTLQRGVERALKRAFYRFACRRTNIRPEHYFSLGRRTVNKDVWNADKHLAKVGARLNFLLQVTPTNSQAAWLAFKASGFSEDPTFSYRPQSVDPLLLKREVNKVRTERVMDATLEDLLRQTQDELDRLITMISDIDSPRFLHGSAQVFGAVDAELLGLSQDLLRTPIPRAGSRDGPEKISAAQFARQANAEFRYYRDQFPGFTGVVEVREDLFSGLMVSSGNLLVGRETTLAPGRVEALLAHEVGTHMVTYYNGKSQPLRLLSIGLAGYDALQEGIAVLSEYLVGGLNPERLRLLAARVVAVHMMMAGATFLETWRCLTGDHGLDARPAYTVTMRVYRGGGLTKDAVYLRGLVQILDYLREGGELEPLFLGKIAIEHVPIVRELAFREVLRPPPLMPRYMLDERNAPRLERLQRGMSVLDLYSAGSGS